MSSKTKIQWTDVSWNPVRGCSLVSAGCQNCYAMKTAHRFSKPGMAYEGLTEFGPQGPRWNGKITLVQKLLDAPLHWKTPRRVFVNSMSDLFHEDVPFDFIDKVFAVMLCSPRHTFQILTKRPARMLEYMNFDSGFGRTGYIWGAAYKVSGIKVPKGKMPPQFPYPHVWLGVSVEDQATAEARIPLLLQTPAAVHWISAEPLLERVNLDRYLGVYEEDLDVGFARVHRGLDWCVIGGESGPGARPCDLSWIRSLKDQCQEAGVKCFVKQLGSKWYDTSARCGIKGSITVGVDDGPWTWVTQENRKGGDVEDSEFPVDLRVRDWPR